MKNLVIVARVALGLIYFVFGLNGFFNFLPAPPMAGAAGAFAGAMAATGYMFPLIKGTEVLGGLLLLLGRPVGLALVMLAPVTLNIFLFHFFLTPGEFAIQAVMAGIHIFLGVANFSKFKSLFAS